jgi:hypothetical protein
MTEPSKNAKRSSVKLPWWGWVLVGVATLLALPSLFSEDPLGIQETYGGLWADLQSIGENIWFFTREGLKAVGFIEE